MWGACAGRRDGVGGERLREFFAAQIRHARAATEETERARRADEAVHFHEVAEPVAPQSSAGARFVGAQHFLRASFGPARRNSAPRPGCGGASTAARTSGGSRSARRQPPFPRIAFFDARHGKVPFMTSGTAARFMTALHKPLISGSPAGPASGTRVESDRRFIAEAFPQLDAAALFREMRELKSNAAYLASLYSREITPRSFARFDAHPEFALLAQTLPGDVPPRA